MWPRLQSEFADALLKVRLSSWTWVLGSVKCSEYTARAVSTPVQHVKGRGDQATLPELGRCRGTQQEEELQHVAAELAQEAALVSEKLVAGAVQTIEEKLHFDEEHAVAALRRPVGVLQMLQGGQQEADELLGFLKIERS